MTKCHVEWKKGTRDAAVQAQMSCGRTSKAPLPKLSPSRAYAGSVGPCASIKEEQCAFGRQLC